MKKWILEAIVFISFIVIFTLYQQKDLLATDGSVQVNEFKLKNLNDEALLVPLPKGQKSLVYFFAPWCGVCRHSMPNLEAIHKDGEKTANIIAIALAYQSNEEVKQFVNQVGLTFPVYLGDKNIKNDFKIQAFPTYYVVDESGKIEYTSMGYSTEMGLRARLAI